MMAKDDLFLSPALTFLITFIFFILYDSGLNQKRELGDD
jgi:hypothetical protein